MPVEIKELVIKATTKMEPDNPEQSLDHASLAEEREAIIEECVKQVLKILQRKKER